MSDTDNGHPPAPKKKGLWSRLTGGWGSESDAPAPAPLQPDASEAPSGDVQPVPDVAADARPQSDAPTMGDAATDGEQEDNKAEESPVEGGQAEGATVPDAVAEGAEAPAAQDDPARNPLSATAPGEEQPAVAGRPSELEPDEAPLAETPLAESSADAEPEPAKTSFWRRLTSGLARTASSLTQGITDLVSKRKLDAETLEELEDILIRADLGTATAARIVTEVGRGRHDKMIGADEVKGLIAAEVESILAPVAKPLVIDGAQKPFIILMVGVNGSGKTTTIGKLAAQWKGEGRKVVLAAGDTFRAAAIEQLKVWGARTGARVVARAPGADAAGVAHDAITEARAEGADILLIDTAGRLQNRTELMAELEKVVRVVKKLEPGAPHAVLLVLDATVGQNALSQVEVFTKIAGVTGLVMTKLDGTARGGILVAIAEKFGLPVHLIGVGEGPEDLQPFAAADFARAIAGIDGDAR
ncbi:signal recognition particle-docking protein FtsY [Roseixanthobacter liquoris]|uniref:signal recognition particle-docking protein FtsY n=1 Tax=Roseixanthobacter liquoris TaxID=3119921 RepID=UPI00372C7D22